jgi:hypothetical protein
LERYDVVVTTFYCHIVRNGVWIEDLEGEDFPNLESARKGAVLAGQELNGNAALRDGPATGTLEITDAEGTVLSVVIYPDDAVVDDPRD